MDEGVGDFFAARKVSKEHVVPDTTTRRQNEINKEKSEEPRYVALFWVLIYIHAEYRIAIVPIIDFFLPHLGYRIKMFQSQNEQTVTVMSILSVVSKSILHFLTAVILARRKGGHHLVGKRTVKGKA